MQSPEEILAGLDEDQRLVATSIDGPVVVRAGAGTGKTRAMTHRIAYAVRSGRWDQRQVLAVTFTTRAAGEMRGRLRSLGAPWVQARTFHSAALRQAQYFWPSVHGTELPPVASNRMGIVAEAAHRSRLSVDTALLRDLTGEISWAKVSNVTPDDYAELATQAGREVSAAPPEVIAQVYRDYEEGKRRRTEIDFDDILLCAASLMTQERVAAQVRGTYQHFVVDEYQDVSPLQESLLRLWLGGRRDLCVVGDAAQTVHSFAGARSQYLTGFTDRYPDATVVELDRDYRSTGAIVSLANALMDGRPEAVRLASQRPSGADPTFHEAANEADEATAVADWLAGLIDDGRDPRELAVLFRINAQSPALEAALTQRSVPYLVRGAERFYERAEVRQALGALSAAATRGDDHPDGAVAGVREILESIGFTPEPPSGGAQRERWESWAALVDTAEDIAAEDDEPATFGAVVTGLVGRAEAQHAPLARGVTLATLHSAKGLEWEAVALVGVHEGTIPFVLADTPAQVDEERRLLYVGITRAKDLLRISWSRGRTGTRGTRGPSRFLAPMAPARRAIGAAPTPRRRKRGSRMSAVCRVCGNHLSTAADHKLGRHEGCPSSYDEALFERLREWRKTTAQAAKVPAYVVFTDATLTAIAEVVPTSTTELLAISGVGQRKLQAYGDDVLALTTNPSDTE